MKTSRLQILSSIIFFVMVLVTSVPAVQTVSGSSLHAAGTSQIYLPLIMNGRSGALSWNAFLGSENNDMAEAIAADGSGNIYVTGYSVAVWGAPINPYAGGYDAFVAKLNSNGALQWNTFLGSTGYDIGYGIAVDESGNVYVSGYSVGAWGTPVNPYADGGDGFAAKLNSSGALQWNTFLGSGSADDARGIKVDGSGNVYVAGSSGSTWGAPGNPYAGGIDAFVAEFNSIGALQWNTFLGSTGTDLGYGIAVDGSGDVYVSGYSVGAWGTPVNPYADGGDGFAARLNNSGALQWNTFLGSASADDARGIAVDGSGNVYVTGSSGGTWGTPGNPYAGGIDALIAKLNSSGVLQWNTFLGSTGNDIGHGISVDGSGNIYMTGASPTTWGVPINPYAGGDDGFAARLNNSGVLQWNTFLGSASDDYAFSVALNESGNVYATGGSGGTWGTPVNPYAGGNDAFIVKIQR